MKKIILTLITLCSFTVVADQHFKTIKSNEVSFESARLSAQQSDDTYSFVANDESFDFANLGAMFQPGDYRSIDSEGACYDHLEVSGNLIVLTMNLSRSTANYSGCESEVITLLFKYDVPYGRAKSYNEPYGYCRNFELIPLSDGNYVLINECTGKSFKKVRI